MNSSKFSDFWSLYFLSRKASMTIDWRCLAGLGVDVYESYGSHAGSAQLARTPVGSRGLAM